MSLQSVIDSIKGHLSKGRLNLAADGIVKTLEDLETRVAAIEERNRVKDCICTKTDTNGEFEIVKRLQEVSSEEQVALKPAKRRVKK